MANYDSSYRTPQLPKPKQPKAVIGTMVGIIVLLLALMGIAYVANDPSPTRFDAEQVQENTIWIDITPPPGIEGPCYVSFITAGRRGYAFAVCQ